MIAALYGTLIKLTANAKIEKCITQFAAFNLSAGIFILLFKNHIPIISANMVIHTAKKICIETAVENTFFNFSWLPFPNS